VVVCVDLRIGTAVFTQDFIIRCCGVVTKWIIVPTSACLAAPTCAMNLSVYSDFSSNSGAATLVGVNLNKNIKTGKLPMYLQFAYQYIVCTFEHFSQY